MSRTYRRYTKRSQNRTVYFMKNIYHEMKNSTKDNSLYLVNYKDKNRFYTDNQKVPNWKIFYKEMNKKSRNEAKLLLSKVKTVYDAEEIIFKYYKSKHSLAKEIWLYSY